MSTIQKDAEPDVISTEEIFEWVFDEDTRQYVKITAKNSNGRICKGCGCKCPCPCPCCKKGCCSVQHEKVFGKK